MKISQTSKKNIGCWAVVLLFCTISAWIPAGYHDYYATFLGVLIFFSYIYNLKLLTENFSDVDSKLWITPLLYSATLTLFSLFYSLPVILLDAVKFNIGNFEAFYYCLITLTTVGYGELHPAGYKGQMLASSMALVGTTHMIMFISILVSNLKKNG